MRISLRLPELGNPLREAIPSESKTEDCAAFVLSSPILAAGSERWQFILNLADNRGAGFSALVIRSAKREGRIRSAERTEVHLIATIRFHELTFCP
jgi:hypothetical protein